MTETRKTICRLKEQGFVPGSCRIHTGKRYSLACRAMLKQEGTTWCRLITSIHLSRPENYLSIYQSGCNFSCRKCHSWYFSKIRDGAWYSPADILEKAAEYEKTVTLWEPRHKATAWHAHDTCRCCGSCVIQGTRSMHCPGVLDEASIALSPQDFGPVRNVVAFTGGDLTCRPDFCAECAELIKAQTDLWLLIETNGYGLTPRNLDYLKTSGVDAFWLDIKAYEAEKHRWLTGCSGDRILKLPQEIIKRGFVLEVLSLFIPGLVEADELEKIARSLADVDSGIPFTILAFFPEYKMKSFRSPSLQEMVRAYEAVKSCGLENVRLGNVGVFAPTERERGDTFQSM